MSPLALNQSTPPAEIRYETGHQERNTQGKAVGRLLETFGVQARDSISQGQQLPPPQKQGKKYSRGMDVATHERNEQMGIDPSASAKFRGRHLPPRTLGRDFRAQPESRSAVSSGSREKGDELAYALRQMRERQWGDAPVQLKGETFRHKYDEERKLLTQIRTLRGKARSNEEITPQLQEVRAQIIEQLRLLEAIRLDQPNRINVRRRFKDARKEALLSDEIDDSDQLQAPDSKFSEDDLLELDERLSAQQEEQQMQKDELRDEEYAEMVREIEEGLNAEDLAWGRDVAIVQKSAEDEEHDYYLDVEEKLQYADAIVAAEEYIDGVEDDREMEGADANEAYLRSQGQAQSQEQTETQAEIELYDEFLDQRYVDGVVRMNDAVRGATSKPEPEPEQKSELEPELAKGNENGNGHVDHPLFASPRITSIGLPGLKRPQPKQNRRANFYEAEA